MKEPANCYGDEETFYWRGKPLRELSAPDLLEAAEFLAKEVKRLKGDSKPPMIGSRKRG